MRRVPVGAACGQLRSAEALGGSPPRRAVTGKSEWLRLSAISRDITRVEVMGLCSNSGTSEELADLRKWIAKSPVRRDARRVRRQKIRRKLSGEEISELVQGYRVGLTVYELATQFGIHRETVAGILEREGVPRRRRPLSPSQIERASILYGSGWSLAQVGAELGCDPSTVWRTLAKIGSAALRK